MPQLKQVSAEWVGKLPGRPICGVTGDEVNDAGRDDDTDGKDYVDYVDVGGVDVYVLKYFGVTVGVGTAGVAVTVWS